MKLGSSSKMVRIMREVRGRGVIMVYKLNQVKVKGVSVSGSSWCLNEKVCQEKKKGVPFPVLAGMVLHN
jgi:hypothetical protein